MLARQAALAQVLQQDPDVENIASQVGSDGTNPSTNVGRMTIALVSKERRQGPLGETMARLSALAANVEGVSLSLQPVQDLQIDTRASRTQYQYTLESENTAELNAYARALAASLATLPELADVGSDHGGDGLDAHLVVDRDAAARLGVSVSSIDDILYDAFGQRIVSTIFTQLNQYRVILEVDPNSAMRPESLSHLWVPGASGPVPLAQLTRLQERLVPLSISHQGQFPAVTLSFNLASGASLGEAMAAIRSAEGRVPPPAHLRASFRGAAEAFSESLASEPALIAAAIVTVYIVLGLLYESYVHPWTILSTLPSAGVGALGALMACKMDFNVLALIGIILLIGIVKKNGIMMVDFAIAAERDDDMAPEQAIFRACVLRFRPIMMTTMAAFLGGVPLAVGTGVGSELRQPLGVCIVGGLLVSQLLTLYTTPIVYLYMHALGEWVTRRRRPVVA